MADTEQQPDLYTEYVVMGALGLLKFGYQLFDLDELEERVTWYEGQDIPNDTAVLEYGRVDLNILEKQLSEWMQDALALTVEQMERPKHFEHLEDLIYRASDLRWQYEMQTRISKRV